MQEAARGNFKSLFYFSSFQFHPNSPSLSSGQKSNMTEDSWADDIADGQLLRWALKLYHQACPEFLYAKLLVFYVCAQLPVLHEMSSLNHHCLVLSFSLSFYCHSLSCLSLCQVCAKSGLFTSFLWDHVTFRQFSLCRWWARQDLLEWVSAIAGYVDVCDIKMHSRKMVRAGSLKVYFESCFSSVQSPLWRQGSHWSCPHMACS